MAEELELLEFPASAYRPTDDGGANSRPRETLRKKWQSLPVRVSGIGRAVLANLEHQNTDEARWLVDRYPDLTLRLL